MSGRYRVLISDPLPPEARQRLEASGEIEVIENTEDLDRVIPEIHGWIVRSGTHVAAERLEVATMLRCVCRAGAGVDNIDLEAATRHGVLVMNTPGSNSIAAAEHTIALMLSLARRIPFAHAEMLKGGWGRKTFVGVEIEGKRLGVIGLGKVGRIVARKARGLGMKVSGHDPFVSPEAAQDFGVELMSFDEVLASSDFLALHPPLTDATRGLIDARALEKCRAGVRIINCSRGQVIDEDALLAAIDSNRVAGAALDVFASEPLAFDSRLRGHPAVVTTPHLGASTVEAQMQVAAASADQVRDYLLDGTAVNAVNTVSLVGEDRRRFRFVVELARRLGSLQSQLLLEQPRAFQIEVASEIGRNTIERLITDSALVGFLESSRDGPVNTINARFLAKQHGIEIGEKSCPPTGAWTCLLRVQVTTSSGRRTVEGAVAGEDSLRLVGFDDFAIDGVLEGPLLITVSIDRPGMVGYLGTLLGRHGVNIANLSLGRDQQGGTALAVFNLDAPIPANVLAEVRGGEGIMSALAVKLPSP